MSPWLASGRDAPSRPRRTFWTLLRRVERGLIAKPSYRQRMSSLGSGKWSLFFGLRDLSDLGDHLVAEALSTGTFRRRALEEEGQPYFLDEGGLAHESGNAFFASGRMRNRSTLTNEKYARVLRLWFNFLEIRGLSWLDASERELFDFKFWRRTDANKPRRVSGALGRWT